MSDYTGAVLEQVMFTEIEVEESVPMEIFQVASTGKRYEWLAGTDLQERLQPEIETDIPSVKKMALPNGFELTGEQISPVAGSSKPARRLMYSDGLSSVSVFVAESGGENGDLLGTSTMGAVSAFGIDLGQWHATVVGEVPIHTVKMVGESIELATP
jgi:sigma-E factor negative regulatory protein RseB